MLTAVELQVGDTVAARGCHPEYMVKSIDGHQGRSKSATQPARSTPTTATTPSPSSGLGHELTSTLDLF